MTTQPQQPAAQKSAATVALDKPARNVGELRALFSRPDVIEQVKLTLPAHMKPERLTKVLLSAVLKTPMLMEVNQLSLLQVLAQLSELGLEPGSSFGHVYLIPFRNRKANRVDVNVIIGYRGLIELARRSGWVEQIESHVVFKGEKFNCTFGLKPVLEHEPDWTVARDPKDALVVYSVVRMKGGAVHYEVMTMDEVRRIRDRSQSWKFKPNEGPWQEDFLQMARKTVLRRTCNYIPLSAEQRDALELEQDEVVDGTVRKPDLIAIPTGDDIASQMAAAKTEESVEGEVVNQETGEVTDAAPEAPADLPLENEPEPGETSHLIWRIQRATAEQLPALIQEAAGLAKDNPLRSAVGTAISSRRKAVRS